MTESVGMVLLTESGERGAFVRPVEIEAFRELITLILRTRTVAGPPLIAGPLEDLAAKLALPRMAGSYLPAEIRLSAVDVECLTLLQHQISLRERLPLRVRRTCTTCGNTKIINPNLVKKSNNGELFGTTADAAIDTIGMIADGHYVRAVIKVMGTAGIIADKTKEDGPVCEECEGQDFATPAVTYCPNCKKLRDETILLECPDCGADFIDPQDRVNPWRAADRAFGDLRRITNVAILDQLAPRFEKALYAGQKNALAAALTGDDELLCMCRCGRPGETLRAIALLFTTRQLVWARQLAVGEVTSGAVPWSSIVRIGKPLPVKDHGPTLEIEASDGTRLPFNGFKGVGVSLDNRSYMFTADAIAGLMSQLASVDMPAVLPPMQVAPMQVAPMPVAPPPAQPPAPLSPPPYPAYPAATPPPRPEPGAVADGPAPTIRAVARVYPQVPAQAAAPQAAPPQQAPPQQAPPQTPPSPAYPAPAQPLYPPPAPAVDLSAAPPPAPPATPGWYEDPFNTYRFRWWDGARWTTTFHR